MNPDDPYQPPANHPPLMPPVAPAAFVPKPVVITVFGILHLILGAFRVFAIASILALPLLVSFLSKSSPALKTKLAFQQQYQWWIHLSTGLTLVLTLLIVIAGIKMLRGRHDGLKWSNRYVLTSVAIKILTVPVNLLVVAPVVRQHALESSLKTPAFFLSNAWYLIVGFAPVIYPALAWILLNRPQVKGWFAAHGLGSDGLPV